MANIDDDIWDATLAELLSLKMVVAGLLEQSAKQTADPASFLAAIHARVIDNIQHSRFRGGDGSRDVLILEQMQERADELLSGISALFRPDD
jgi:hypothetical protein